jgi:hypothetical protein
MACLADTEETQSSNVRELARDQERLEVEYTRTLSRLNLCECITILIDSIIPSKIILK